MAHVRRLTVRARIEQLSQIVDFVSQAAADTGFNADEIFHIQMAVDEACTNVVEHAYGGSGRGDIGVTCLIDPARGLRIEIRDRGKPFNPNSVPIPNSIQGASDVDQLGAGGLGIYFMRKLMDLVEFHFDDRQGNLLVMEKRRSR
jgi:anti-sigma regulatory factor (Ser/Thr protein kinase)